MNGQARASKKEGREFDNGHSNTKYIRWQILGTKVIDRYFHFGVSSENLDSRNANDPLPPTLFLSNVVKTVGVTDLTTKMKKKKKKERKKDRNDISPLTYVFGGRIARDVNFPATFLVLSAP